jgi:hypothetical protein
MQQWYQCPRCSAAVAFGTRFCGNCGLQLNWPTQPQYQPPLQYQQQHQQLGQTPQYQQAEPPKKKDKGIAGWLGGIIVLAAIIGGIIFVTSTSSPETSLSTSSLSSNLLIYLDENYTEPWESTNMPDLSNLVWSASPTQEGWETSTLTVFLKNTGVIPIKVNADSSSKPGFAVIGFSVSSDTIVLKPNEYSSLAITINVSPVVRSMLYPDQDTVKIYFHISAAN